MNARAASLALLLLVGATIPVVSQTASGSAHRIRPESVDNLLASVSSDNAGVRHSAILLLGTLRSERAVIPLMRVLHSDAPADIRSAAAYALCRIGNSAGTYAVLRCASFDEDAGVRARCGWYYRTFVVEGLGM